MENKPANFELTVRRFTTEDTELLCDFFLAASEETRYFMDAHPYDRETAVRLTSPAEISKPDVIRYAATIKGDKGEVMVGYLFFWEWRKKIPWLGIAIRDGYKGMGIGRKVMEFAAQEAKSHGKGGILLTTKLDNQRGQALYKKCGYEFIGKKYFSEDNCQHLLLLNFDEE